MAITAVPSCLGPPPLPPGKRFLQRSTTKKLSSTYLSFRDPAVESWIPIFISEQQQSPPARHAVIKSLPQRPRSRASYTTTTHDIDNIDNNYDIDNCDNIFLSNTKNLIRSRSEGNLYFNSKKNNLTLTPLDKCIKAIYGSWKNLMQCKSVFMKFILNYIESSQNIRIYFFFFYY